MLRPIVPISLAICAVVPAAAHAQTVLDLGAFYEGATPYLAPGGVGGELGYGGTVAQLRLSGRAGALDVPGSPRFWLGDLDLKLAPLNVHPFLRALPPFGAEPYLFAGVGARFEEGYDGGNEWDTSLSWGIGVRFPLLGRTLALYGEGRSREGDWELRGGLGLRLTSGPRGTSSAPALIAGPSVDDAARARPDDVAAEILAEAERHLGVRYVWGGSDPATGFDCSGFVRYVYASVGISLPRVTREQAQAGSALPLDLSAFRPGDLLFFATDGRNIDHVAIYAGDGRIIHAPNRSDRVRYDDLNGPAGRWYRERLVRARRVI